MSTAAAIREAAAACLWGPAGGVLRYLGYLGTALCAFTEPHRCLAQLLQRSVAALVPHGLTPEAR